MTALDAGPVAARHHGTVRLAIAFAWSGDLATLTGGYGYDRRLIASLREAGHDVELIELGGSFPDPTAVDIADAAEKFAAVAPERVLIVDGLAYSSLPTAAFEGVRTAMVALVHHPLALETGIDPSRAQAIAATERSALRFAAGVVVTSSMTRGILVADYGVPAEKITVALPGLARAWRLHAGGTGAATTGGTKADPPLIVSVGSVIPRKGYDVLIAAFDRIADLSWRAVIVGGLDRAPETAAAVRRQAEPLGARVAFAGELDEAAIRALYAQATVFALATRYEGFGMVFAEAMAAGLPIVLTRGGAAADVVPESAGILADVDDAGAVAAALRRILTDPALAKRLSRAAQETGAAFHDWDVTAGRVADRAAMAMEQRP